MDAPPILQPRGGPKWWMLGLLIGLMIIALGILWRFNPSHSPFYPRCILYTSTGIQCPGCGGLRATHYLLHGNIAAAFAQNALAICLLPFATLFGLDLFLQHVRGKSLLSTRLRTRVPLGLLMGIVTGFTLARNLPLARWLGWH